MIKNQKNMKEYDKRKSHTSSKLRVIYISSNNVRHPLTKTGYSTDRTNSSSTVFTFKQTTLCPNENPISMFLTPLYTERTSNLHMTTPHKTCSSTTGSPTID